MSLEKQYKHNFEKFTFKKALYLLTENQRRRGRGKSDHVFANICWYLWYLYQEQKKVVIKISRIIKKIIFKINLWRNIQFGMIFILFKGASHYPVLGN